MKGNLEALSASLREFVSGKVTGGVELPPLFIFVKGNDFGWIPVAEIFQGETGRDAFAAALPAILRLVNAEGYIFCHEVWVTRKLPQGSTVVKRIRAGEIEIEDLPPDDRHEAVIMFVVEKGRAADIWTADINNAPGGRALAPFAKLTGGTMRGRYLIEKW